MCSTRLSRSSHAFVSRLGVWLLIVIGCARSQALYVVTAPVADLRAQPGEWIPSYAHDPNQETQLLSGERVRLIDRRDTWVRVEAVEQPEYTHRLTWQGYPGWVAAEALAPLRDDDAPDAVIVAKWAAVFDRPDSTSGRLSLPMGTRLRLLEADGLWRSVRLADGTRGWIAADAVRPLDQIAQLSETARRQAIIHAADQFVGDPYVWGGRSPQMDTRDGRITGVDCSGLVNLAYRAAGLDIPRDAHEQYLRATPVAVPSPADLVFLSERGDPERIVHVMLYTGEGWLIEGPGTGLAVRRIRVEDRLGRSITQLRAGEWIDGQMVWLGTYFP